MTDLSPEYVRKAGEALQHDEQALTDWASGCFSERIRNYLGVVQKSAVVDPIAKLCVSVCLGRIIHERDLLAIEASESSFAARESAACGGE